MTKDEFNLLNIEEQIKAINELVKLEGSLTKACDRLTVSRTTLRERYKKIGYLFCKPCNMYIKNISEHKCNANVIQSKENPIKSKIEYNENTSVLLNESMKEKFMWMMSNFEILEAIINDRIQSEHTCNTDIIEVKSSEFTIDLPDSPTHHTTIRVNKAIWDDFNDIYNSKYKHLNKIDVLSMALKQFNDKNK